MLQAAQVGFRNLRILRQQDHVHGLAILGQRHGRPEHSAETSAQVPPFAGYGDRAAGDHAPAQGLQQRFQVIVGNGLIEEPARVVGRVRVYQMGSLQPEAKPNRFSNDRCWRCIRWNNVAKADVAKPRAQVDNVEIGPGRHQPIATFSTPQRHNTVKL